MGRGLLEVKVKQPHLEVLTVAICSLQDVEDILPNVNPRKEEGDVFI
jgi:hypothetical protein